MSMEQFLEFEIGSRVFKVELPDLDEEIRRLEQRKVDFGPDYDVYQVIYTQDDSTEEQVFGDLDKMISFLKSVKEDSSALKEYVSKVRKKKNGDFWLRSIEEIVVADHCTEYFTDFTNAWSVLMISLDVEDATTCSLNVRTRTVTN